MSEVEGKKDFEPTDEELALSVRVLYTNWKGTTRWRHLLPRRWYYGATEWHKEPQYLMEAVDLETGEVKSFAMEGVRDWGNGPDLPPRSAAGPHAPQVT